MESPTPLVGRESELARLVTGLAAVPSDQSAVAVVTGLPGMGKSALARTLAQQIASPDQVIIEAATRSGPGGTPAPADVVAHEILQVSSAIPHARASLTDDGTPDRRLWSCSTTPAMPRRSRPLPIRSPLAHVSLPPPGEHSAFLAP